MTLRLRIPLLALGLLALGLPPLPAEAPARPPAAARAYEAIPPRERQQFAAYHRRLVEQFGGEVRGPAADHVRTVGRRVAVAALPGSRAEDWTITLLDSPVPNAMAVPGGYLYVTRGLLAMMNSEAELASVLGHEAGHIAARHAQRRQTPQAVGALGTIAAAILFGADAGRLAQIGSAALIGGYSRNQEREADLLGLQAMARAGYDPMGAPSMLEALDRVAAVEGRARLERAGLASIFATHPVTAERVQRLAAEARRMPPGGVVNRDAFLSAIDGIAWGDAAEQGLVEGPRFRHGFLGLAFSAPAGFTLQNSPAAVLGEGRGGAFRFTGMPLRPGQPLEEAAAEVWQQAAGAVPPVRPQARRVNGLEALVAPARLPTRGGLRDVAVAVIRFSDTQGYVFLTEEAPGEGVLLETLLSSFRRLSPEEAAEARRGLRIRVVTVRPGETAETLARRMAPPYDRPETLLALNGLSAAGLRPGLRVKLIAP